MTAGQQGSADCPVDDVTLPRLVEGTVDWRPGGLLADWTPAHGPRRTPVVGSGRHGLRVALTRVDARTADPVSADWRRWQRRLVEPAGNPPLAPSSLWWRLAVQQRVFALCAERLPDIDTTIAQLRSVVGAAPRLTVAFADRTDAVDPDWVVLDHDVPVLVGLAGFALVRVADPRHSLAGMLRSARLHRYVHDIRGPGRDRPPVVLPRRATDLAAGGTTA
jgi:hypothetical protein